MASGGGAVAYSSTIATLSVAETVALTGATGITQILIQNRSVNELWYRCDGTAATVAGADCFLVAPNFYASFNHPAVPNSVSVISGTAGGGYTVSVVRP
jgi:hypothetical protein